MKQPSKEKIDELAADLLIGVSDQELEDFTEIVSATLDELAKVEELPEPRFAPEEYEYTDRNPGYHPTEEEDPYNAWITKCRVEGADEGLLSGMTVGLKDTISLAGVTLTLNSRVMESYVPTIDATVVTRLLDAGATILGKNNMIGAGTAFGIAKNPTAPELSIGGSSSGGASAVAAGDVDIAIGGDQAGSIRVPAAFGGLVGLKPTHGLVPYTGIYGYDRSIDHTGPITRTVEDAALATEAMAGRDGLDPRQPRTVETEQYSEALVDDVSDMNVAVLEEGFTLEQSEEDVNGVVRDAIDDLERLGADTTRVSIPGHAHASPIVFTVLFYGMAQSLKNNGETSGSHGWYDTDLVEFLGRARHSMSKDMPVTVKTRLLVTEFLQRDYHGSLYGKAKNAALALRREYDTVLETADAIVLPTSPKKPDEYGERGDIEELTQDGILIPSVINTGTFNITHHPAITVPCGRADGAPVGLMLVGDHFDESTLFQLAYAYEQHTDHGVPTGG